eukprot:CAMPEP_0194059610 /NCGR_PEP_ID=MMETSP0009_2-20130614/69521_1 /TAXON_ID=210454 /ORGANISM="Grammatophora oceanica, Strain CCMP 410" /LENGTH=82 /DNA_ID=CAMNT_0038710221 /DNA_START=100 /DNA_END=344 /DNA_ORIENTATION=+
MGRSSSNASADKTLLLTATFTLSVLAFRLMLHNQSLQKQVKKLKKKSSKAAAAAESGVKNKAIAAGGPTSTSAAVKLGETST